MLILQRYFARNTYWKDDDEYPSKSEKYYPETSFESDNDSDCFFVE